MTGSQPPITGTTHTLPFDRLSPRDFERLCLWLVEREEPALSLSKEPALSLSKGYERAEHLGAAGSEQGRDIVAWREGALWAFQRTVGSTRWMVCASRSCRGGWNRRKPSTPVVNDTLAPDHRIAIIELQPGEFEISVGDTLWGLLEGRIVDVHRLLVKADDEHSMVSGIRPVG